MAEDWDRVEQVQQEMSRLEHEADKLKKSVRLHLPKSLFLPVPRSDLLELLSVQDKVANRAKDIAGLMLGRQMAIPQALQPLMRTYVQRSVDASAQALKAMNELDELLETGFAGREAAAYRVEHGNVAIRNSRRRRRRAAALPFRREVELAQEVLSRDHQDVPMPSLRRMTSASSPGERAVAG